MDYTPVFTPNAARAMLVHLLEETHRLQMADPIHRSMAKAHDLLNEARSAIQRSLMQSDQELLAIAWCYMGMALVQIDGNTALLDQMRDRLDML